MISTMPTISIFAKNGFFHVKLSETSSRVRSSSVPPEFSPEPFQTMTPKLTTPPEYHKSCQAIDNSEPPHLLKMTPLPIRARQLQNRKAWADMGTDDEAETTDDELPRTFSNDTKCSSADVDDSSICGEAPSIASTCATPIRTSNTPLSAKANPFQPASRSGPRQVSLSAKAIPFQPASRSKPRQVPKFFPQDDAAAVMSLKKAAVKKKAVTMLQA